MVRSLHAIAQPLHVAHVAQAKSPYFTGFTCSCNVLAYVVAGVAGSAHVRRTFGARSAHVRRTLGERSAHGGASPNRVRIYRIIELDSSFLMY
jgi:hypothetical protein